MSNKRRRYEPPPAPPSDPPAVRCAKSLTDDEREALLYMAEKDRICGGTKTMESLLGTLEVAGCVRFQEDLSRNLALAGPPFYPKTGVVFILPFGREVADAVRALA